MPDPSALPEVAHVGSRTELLPGASGNLAGQVHRTTRPSVRLELSRAGALGHIQWASDLVDEVVPRFFQLLKLEPVIHAYETGWRINGKNVWMWCFCNPSLALFLVDEHRSGPW